MGFLPLGGTYLHLGLKRAIHHIIALYFLHFFFHSSPCSVWPGVLSVGSRSENTIFLSRRVHLGLSLFGYAFLIPRGTISASRIGYVDHNSAISTPAKHCIPSRMAWPPDASVIACPSLSQSSEPPTVQLTRNVTPFASPSLTEAPALGSSLIFWPAPA